MPSDVLSAVPFAIVDLETTGWSARDDRVTEVAVVRLERGRMEVAFEALLAPGRSIPPVVTRLTGITARMIEGCPSLEQVLPQLELALAGAIVVAHNATFDASFLAAAFARAGRTQNLRWLCTLRLARRLLPARRGYRLASLAADLDLAATPAHRARADAETAGHLLARLLAVAEQRQLGLPDLLALAGLPGGGQGRGVDRAVVGGLPDGPGVYLLRDQAGDVLYVGKSTDVRRRVREHLRRADAGPAEDTGQPRLQRVLPAVRDVGAVATQSELEALFLESRLIKRYLPQGNVLQRGERDLPFVRIDPDEPFPRLEATREAPDGRVVYFGPYRRAYEVADAVELLRAEVGLRACGGRLRPRQRPCYLLELRKCLGPCVGAVDERTYRCAATRAIECLSGRDRAVLDRLAARRDALAEQLRFEEAAELRDRLRALEWLAGVEQRPRRVDERNLVVVSPTRLPGERQLFFVQAGCLADQFACSLPGEAGQLGATLEQVYAARPAERLSRAEVDDMLLLERWLAQRRAEVQVVPVMPGRPLDALPHLLAALACEGSR